MTDCIYLKDLGDESKILVSKEPELSEDSAK